MECQDEFCGFHCHTHDPCLSFRHAGDQAVARLLIRSIAVGRFDGPMSTDITLNNGSDRSSTDQGDSLIYLLAALEASFTAGGESGNLLADPAALTTIIADLSGKVTPGEDLGPTINRHLQNNKLQLAPALKIRLLFLQHLFSSLIDLAALDASLSEFLSQLRPAFLQLGLGNEKFYVDPRDPQRLVFDRLLRECAGWYANAGREGVQFYEAAMHAVKKSLDEKAAGAALNEFLQFIDKQDARAKTLEQRCRESELGTAKIQRAQSQVAALLDELTGCSLPESVLHFLRTTLKSELQFILINQGDTVSAWQSWSAIIHRLPQVYPVLALEAEKPVEPELPNRTQLYRDAQIIVSLLDEYVTVSAANQHAYDEGVANFREQLFERLRGTAQALQCFELLSTPDELTRAGVSVSPALLKKVAHLKAGDWFLFLNNDNQWLRCKLLLRPPEVESFVFVNRFGHRVLQKSVRDFSACLAAHIAKPLIIEPYFPRALAKTVTKLQALLNRNQTRRQTASPVISADPNEYEQEAVELAEQTPVPESKTTGNETAVVSHPAKDRNSAGAKALREARVLAKLAVRRERREQRLAGDGVAASAGTPSLAEALAQVDRVNVGAWFELQLGESSAHQRCKLVAIMRSVHTYIFTDRRGVKVAEYPREHLAQMLIATRARIISNGDNFEGQLSKVVMTLRRDL